MKLEYITHNGNPRLLLIFTGWSTDSRIFSDLTVDGYDVAVAWDYTDLNYPELPRSYDEVVVIAWSLGVWAASCVVPQLNLPLTLALAVNGTPSPVSDSEGIPVEIFRKTAEGLDERTFAKFRRRMGGASLPEPLRSVEDLQQELFAIDNATNATNATQQMAWDRAIVGCRDLIFPPANQLEAWRHTRTLVTADQQMTHTPESWRRIIDRYVIDKSLVKGKFTRGMETYTSQASVQQRAADHLWQLWQKYKPAKGSKIIEFGSGDGSFTRLYEPKLKPSELTKWDIVSLPDVTRVCDAETAIADVADSSVDAIVSANTIQWFNSPARFLERASRKLRAGGMIVISTFGPATFRELAEAGVVPLPYLSLDDYRKSVPESMELLELHDGIVTKVFSEPIDVVRHLRATGVNARPTEVSLPKLLKRYPLNQSGKAPLTYNPLYILLRKKP